MTDNFSFGNTILLVTRDGMGTGPQKLQRDLLEKYLALLLDNRMLPAAICFYTEGVHLVCEGSPLVERLRSIEQTGTRLIVCSTCLDYFNLRDKVGVGIVGGMPDVIDAQARAAKVITI